MNRRVTFKTLWLVSERELKARRQTFSPNKTILYGPNGTGKSRITKHLFWAFGCTPQKYEAPGWDQDAVAAVEFSFNGKDYLVLRQKKQIGLFDVDGGLLACAENMSAWEKAISPFFGYHLKLQRPLSIHQSQAGLEYLTLPFYVDQDGSWGPNWDTYSTLGQFKNWKTPVFEAFIGLRPNGYFAAKQRQDEISAQYKEKQKEFDTQRLAFTKVREILPKDMPILDFDSFRDELIQLGRRAQELQQKQNVLRGKLVAVVNLREKLHAELRLAMESQRDLNEDLGYLSAIPETSLECPTCGTIHENSFHGRLQLSQDSQSMAMLVSELKEQKEVANEKHLVVKANLREIEIAIAQINELMQQRRADISLEDVIAAHSAKTLNIAFTKVTSNLTILMENLEIEEEKQKSKVKEYEDKNRLKEVRRYFVNALSSISTLLNIPLDEQLPKPKPGARAQIGGSSAPRSMLAVHLAMLQTNAEHGDFPFFPFVVDTPQQSGQDVSNLRSMIEILGSSAGDNHQVILAVEMLPDGVNTSGFEIVNFDEKKGVLRSLDYQAAISTLSEPLRKLKVELAGQRSNSVATTSGNNL